MYWKKKQINYIKKKNLRINKIFQLSVNGLVLFALCLLPGIATADYPTETLIKNAMKNDPEPGKLKSYDYYMKILIELAKLNPKLPFSAMIINTNNGKILCTGLNLTKPNGNPIWTAEIVAIDNCAKQYPNHDWKNTALITTAEPDIMSQEAIIRFGIPLTVYGTSLPFIIKQGKPVVNIRAEYVIKHAPYYHGRIIGNVLENKTNHLYENLKANHIH
ncbi:nucleoside deaminase [Legionella israelensis]|uniref:Nucleoside deaminase n=1 Tax=Legionella israelensis TaxID=454 RepID=A0AAX1EI46_9GAMM|nr:nucleoside deaminase [Legionella israelensis]QBR84734.1 nucleoside deaminase [Legionella israelensis]